MVPKTRRYAVYVSALAGVATVALLAVVAMTGREESALLEKASDSKAIALKGQFNYHTDDGLPRWSAAKSIPPPAPHASALPIDYLSFFTSDMFAMYSDSCCRTLYFPPGAGKRLPMDMDRHGTYVLRLRNFIANRNSFIFNGGDEHVIKFINYYFGFNVKQIPVVSGFKRRESLMVLGDPSTASSIPKSYAKERQIGATYYGGLPDKLAPTADMVAVDTLSLPGASIIIYNNWPRVPTGTPSFIIRYCQIEDPYKEGGKPLKVEVIECPAAEAKGFPCSCGFINFVGWDWVGSSQNIWDSSIVNADTQALTFSLGDKKGTKNNKKSAPQHLAAISYIQTNVHEDCSGGNCHFV